MKQSITEHLHTLEVAPPREAGNLQIFGLHWANPNGLPYATLDEALAAGNLDITEVSEGGQVPHLKVTNKADTLVFLMSGEQLVGAKQNRILNASIMVPAQTELPIPVSCVEARRWQYRSPKFGSSGSSSHRRLRHLMAKQVLHSYRQTGKPSSRQAEVWEEVDRKLKVMKSVSPTAALDQAYEDHEKTLDEFLQKLQAPATCHGVVFAIGGRIAGMDLFDKPATLVKLWPKLVRGYAIDAVEEVGKETVPVSLETVKQWLGLVDQAQTESFKSPGLGQDIRLEGKDLVGASLVVEENPIHVELYPNEEDGAGK